MTPGDTAFANMFGRAILDQWCAEAGKLSAAYQVIKEDQDFKNLYGELLMFLCRSLIACSASNKAHLVL